MGFFDKIVKKALSNAITDTLTDKIKDTIQDNFDINLDNISNNNSDNPKSYSIPTKYSAFPTYNGTMLEKPVERETPKYSRITLRYNGTDNNQFLAELLQNGFVKGSNVRYDKGNTYVIVDNLGNKTEIVYHIKK